MADRRRETRTSTGPGSPARAGLAGLKGFLADAGGDATERLVYQRVRLGILSALAVNSKLTFPDLKKLLRTTDGNLAVHARKLEDAGMIGCVKSFSGRVPRTEYALTAAGRRALERYLDHMEALLRATRGGD
ncbi:MAG TPA: transcriptional regulator [Thermoanaerobaculia bacterium]|nr:transcriptional regulator [Thermoanaerobaculia bacterium]